MATHQHKPLGPIHCSPVSSSTLLLFSFAPATHYLPSYNFSTAPWNARSMENCTALFTSLWKPDSPENATYPGVLRSCSCASAGGPESLTNIALHPHVQHQQHPPSRALPNTNYGAVSPLHGTSLAPGLVSLSFHFKSSYHDYLYYRSARYLCGQPAPNSPCLLSKEPSLKRHLTLPGVDS